MTITDNRNITTSHKLIFKHLPGYASFVLENKLDEYVTRQLRFSKEENVPLLRFFSHLPDEELFRISKKSVATFLTLLKTNAATDLIQTSTDYYVKNLLPEIARDHVLAEDITVISMVRRKSLRSFLADYTSDFDLCCGIMEEVDRFIMASETASFNAYIHIQKEKISGINHELENRYSELLLTQEQLQRTETLNKQSQALTHIGNWVWDLAENTITWSDEMYRIYGMEPQSEPITFERFISFVHPADRDKRISEIEEALKTQIVNDYTMRIISLQGTEKVLKGRGDVVSGKNNNPEKLVGTCQDITTEYNLNKELTDKVKQFETLSASLAVKNDELSQINKELESFNYVASHDLQEPLRKIQTFISRINDKAKPELVSSGTLDYINKILISSQRMQLLIEDLLTYTHTRSDQTDFRITDLNEVLAEVKSILAPHIEEKQAVIDCPVLPGVMAIPFQMQQLLLNLIGNSVKYARSDAPPRIVISCRSLGGEALSSFPAIATKQYIELKVNDNGIGFDEIHKDKIFGLFQRLHNKDKYSGSGTGLAICKKIVNNHKGFINAESKPGQGSTFTVYIPAEKEERPIKDRLVN